MRIILNGKCILRNSTQDMTWNWKESRDGMQLDCLIKEQDMELGNAKSTNIIIYRSVLTNIA